MRHGSGAAGQPAHHTCPPPGRAPCPAGGVTTIRTRHRQGWEKAVCHYPPGTRTFQCICHPAVLLKTERMVRQDAPAGSRTGDGPAIWPSPSGGSCCGATLRRQGQKKRSPGSGAPHHTARKGERYQRLALKKASILSKGIMSTLSYRSVCEARGTIISSLLLPLSFLKASSLK